VKDIAAAMKKSGSQMVPALSMRMLMLFPIQLSKDQYSTIQLVKSDTRSANTAQVRNGAGVRPACDRNVKCFDKTFQRFVHYNAIVSLVWVMKCCASLSFVSPSLPLSFAPFFRFSPKQGAVHSLSKLE
jgi:hypothetical protein